MRQGEDNLSRREGEGKARLAHNPPPAEVTGILY